MPYKRVQLVCSDPSLAIQSQAAEADINNIVRSFGVTGQLPTSVRLPQYGDFTGVDDYRSAVEAVMAAEASFLEVPAWIREKFANDPHRFAEYCLDASNLPQLREWGLASPAPSGAAPSADAAAP